MTNYNFGEKAIEKAKNRQTGAWEEMQVWQTPKYIASKAKAIELIEKGDYGLSEGDFWILMNRGGSKMCYTGLIISHNGCLKINDKLEGNFKFKPESVSFLVDDGGNKVMQYINNDQGVYEFGEISPKNCSNDYPYAMVLKRLMDRVILKNSKVGFFEIYSDSESEEFKEKQEGNQEPKKKNQFAGLAETAGQDLKEQAEESRLDKLKLALDDMGSVEEIDGYLEVKYQGKTRLEVLQTMSEVNAKRAENIIRNAKLAIDPENDSL